MNPFFFFFFGARAAGGASHTAASVPRHPRQTWPTRWRASPQPPPRCRRSRCWHVARRALVSLRGGRRGVEDAGLRPGTSMFLPGLTMRMPLGLGKPLVPSWACGPVLHAADEWQTRDGGKTVDLPVATSGSTAAPPKISRFRALLPPKISCFGLYRTAPEDKPLRRSGSTAPDDKPLREANFPPANQPDQPNRGTTVKVLAKTFTYSRNEQVKVR